MIIDKRSVVYFINEAYGTVIRVRGENREIAVWNPKRGGFTDRIGLLEASFLARHDRYEGHWCVAHPTRNVFTALKAAAGLKPCLPSKDGMRLARAAKEAAIRAELREKGGLVLAEEMAALWQKRETEYAAM